jgi:hypothetical protein
MSRQLLGLTEGPESAAVGEGHEPEGVQRQQQSQNQRQTQENPAIDHMTANEDTTARTGTDRRCTRLARRDRLRRFRTRFDRMMRLCLLLGVTVAAASVIRARWDDLTGFHPTRVDGDMAGLRAAIGAYERERGPFVGTSFKPLVGVSLASIPLDPWNHPYLVDSALGLFGSDGGPGLQDEPYWKIEILRYYKPPIRLVGATMAGPGRLSLAFDRPYALTPGADPAADLAFLPAPSKPDAGHGLDGTPRGSGGRNVGRWVLDPASKPDSGQMVMVWQTPGSPIPIPAGWHVEIWPKSDPFGTQAGAIHERPTPGGPFDQTGRLSRPSMLKMRLRRAAPRPITPGAAAGVPVTASNR